MRTGHFGVGANVKRLLPLGRQAAHALTDQSGCGAPKFNARCMADPVLHFHVMLKYTRGFLIIHRHLVASEYQTGTAGAQPTYAADTSEGFEKVLEGVIVHDVI